MQSWRWDLAHRLRYLQLGVYVWVSWHVLDVCIPSHQWRSSPLTGPKRPSAHPNTVTCLWRREGLSKLHWLCWPVCIDYHKDTVTLQMQWDVNIGVLGGETHPGGCGNQQLSWKRKVFFIFAVGLCECSTGWEESCTDPTGEGIIYYWSLRTTD